MSADQLIARAYLSRVAEPGSLAVADFVASHGPVAAAARIRAGDVPAQVADATGSRRASADGEADLDAAAHHGIRLVTPESEGWPHFAFAALYAAQQRRLDSWRAGARAARYGGEPTVPIALWVKGHGDLSRGGVRSVALVGARAATPYGEHVAAELAYALARQDVAVVSGGAFGIDAAAHRGALAADGVTLLVSAGGLDRPYPRAHASLFERVAEAGLLVSESPPGASPQRHRFLSRNRIIAALAAGTVVVEAAPRSGALNTAAHSGILGRPVMAVPGPITSAASAGCHALLRQDTEPAVLVTCADDVLEVIGTGGALPTSAAASGSAAGVAAGVAGADRSMAGGSVAVSVAGGSVAEGPGVARSHASGMDGACNPGMRSIPTRGRCSTGFPRVAGLRRMRWRSAAAFLQWR